MKMILATAGLSVVICLSPSTATANEECDEAEAMPAESSVLVIKRESTTTQPSSTGKTQPTNRLNVGDVDAQLEPISQIPEHAPELADQATIDNDAQFGHELTKIATPGRAAEEQAADIAAAYRERTVTAEPARFNGIQPGMSTREDVLQQWNEPARAAASGGGEILTYAMEPFEAVEVLLTDDVVSAIKIELVGRLSPRRLARQLSIDQIDAVNVADDEGQVLGSVYPERGVLFIYDPASDTAATQAVSHVVIQPLDANAFALRAEQRLHGPYQQNIDDLEFALSLDPSLAHAHWLLAEIYLAVGRADQAESAAFAACELDPNNAAYELRRAQADKLLGRYDEATRAVRALLDRNEIAQLTKAQALHEMAQLATLGEAGVAVKATDFENTAIELADSLADSPNAKERRAAKQLLVEAHLAVARDIARRDYPSKLESISQWVGRASGLAEDFIATDGGSLELRLLVAKEALTAMASFKSNTDPAAFIAEAKLAADALAEQSEDEFWQRRIRWEMGQAYFQAVRTEHLRLQSASALRYGQLAIENLADGAEIRQAVPASEQLVGELYFQIGAIHAVHKQDHKTAVEWYDKAAPLLTAPQPYSELVAPQRDGEQLVSMGVSYWQIGDKDRSLDLTLDGVELVQQAVDAGMLAEASLAVPYGNLAAMYQQLGETGDAAKYAELARTASGNSSAIARRGSRNTRSTAVARSGREVSQASSSRVANREQPAPRPARKSSQRQDGLWMR
jgi:tetratricopeptide (TPR) repeat protein